VDKYKVVTTFCDDKIEDTEHVELSEATQEYTNKVAEALEPTDADAKHVRLVQFYKLDEHDNEHQFTSAGPFACEDRRVSV
jgi:hypothetical protein